MRGMQFQDGPERDALARARLAQDAERLTTLHVEADAVHRMDRAVRRDESDLEVLDRKQVAHGLAAFEWPEPGTRMWQATACWPASASGGSIRAQTSSAKGQRVRKRQPDGGSMGLGGSPWIGASWVRLRGSIDGRAESSARV